MESEHLDPGIVLEMLAGRISEGVQEAAHRHLGACAACRGVLAELVTASFVDAKVGPAALAERYELVSPLGRGGMGIVYRAAPMGGGPVVALKWMRVERGSDGRERFRREARVARSLSHANIVRTLDHGELPDGTLYIAMELLEGEDMHRRLGREKRIAVDEVVSIGCALADGLEHAHRAGIVHRDIKPANVFLCKDGSTKILDFGLAVPLDAERLTQSHVRLGTPAYMAPEQAEALGDEDPRTDVWGLAATLHSALAGRSPFASADPISQLLKITRDPPHPLPDHVPAWLTETLLRGLRKERSERWQSIRELGDALRSREGAPAPRTTVGSRRRRPPPIDEVATAKEPTVPETEVRTEKRAPRAAVAQDSDAVATRRAPLREPRPVELAGPARAFDRRILVAGVAVAALLVVGLAAVGIGVAIVSGGAEPEPRPEPLVPTPIRPAPTPIEPLVPVPSPAPLPDGLAEHAGTGWRFIAPSHIGPAPPSYVHTVRELAGAATASGTFIRIAMTVEPGAGDLESYLEQRGQVLEAVPITAHEVVVSGHAGVELETSFIFGTTVQRSIHRIAIVDGTAYGLGCYAGESDFEDVREMCQGVIGSLAIGP